MPSRPASTNGPATSGPRGNRRRAAAAIIALLAVLSSAVASTAAAAQEDNTASDSTTVRIVARKLDSGRIEFGLQQRQPDNTWGDRQLPTVRFFPTTATVNRWLASSTLDLPAGEVRIVARKLESGRIEFGLQQRQPDNTWGDRQLPTVRFFPTTATMNRWLASSPLTLTTPQPTPQPTDQSTDRDAVVTDGDQTTSRPADRDTTTTDDDQYAQFEGDTVEVANPHSWWQRPRGDLVVHVHLCVEQGNEHLAKREVIDAHVRALNEIEAPFYTWQSSGLLNVSFTAGTITIANDVASTWRQGYLPSSCTRSLSSEAHIGHAVILAGNPEEIVGGIGGWGNLGGPIGVTYIEGAAAQTVASIKRQLDRLIFVTRHELDHNIGNPHINGVSSGPTRFIFRQWENKYGGGGDVRLRKWSQLDAQLVGTLAGFPAALQQQEGFTVFQCYFLEAQGWPVGPNAPGCGRPAPPEVQDLRFVDWHADGRPRVTWRPPPTHPYIEPVTGYTIRLHKDEDDLDSGVTFDLPADARSFVLPPSPIDGPIGEYQIGDVFYFAVIPRSAVGLGDLEFTSAAVGFPQTVIRIEEVDTGIENRQFDLSWPSNDLVEHWSFSGTEGLSTGRNWVEISNNFYTITEGHDVIRGETYDLTVLGCLKDPPPNSPFFGCVSYATATFTPETPETRVATGAVTWTDTGIEGRPCSNCPPDGRIYQAEWTHIPGTTEYYILAKTCTDVSRPCPFEGSQSPIVGSQSPKNVELDYSGMVTTRFFLSYGTTYELDIHACGPEDEGKHPRSCPVLLRSEITVPPSGS